MHYLSHHQVGKIEIRNKKKGDRHSLLVSIPPCIMWGVGDVWVG